MAARTLCSPILNSTSGAKEPWKGMGVAQGHSLCCLEVALGLDTGLLTTSALCTTTGGLLGGGGWLGHALSLSFFGGRCSGLRQVLASLTRPGGPLLPLSPGPCTLTICTSPSRQTCLSPQLAGHVIFLLIQSLAQGSGQYAQEHIASEVKTPVSPPVERTQGALLSNSPGMKLQSSVRSCHGISEHCAVWLLGHWERGARPAPLTPTAQ